MKKKMKKYLQLVLIITILLSGVILIGKNTFLKKEEKFNIAYLSDEFVEEYFEEISKADSDEEKENMVIVISDSKIKDSYGAKNIIEAPNHQYILQYDSKEKKEYAIKQLKEDKRIESVEENAIYTTEEVEYDSWGIEKMALDHAITSANNNSKNMQQVTVAIIDTGCDMTLFNKYYSGKISELYNVLEKSTTSMMDENGHGTHIAGTIAEGTPDNVKIIPIKVSRTGSIYFSDIIAGINYIVRNNSAQVINMSFGGYVYSEALEQAIESANKKNIISVTAAGNDNTDKNHYPSAFENTISIASVDSNLNKSEFSNFGSQITFTAPGTAIRSIMGKDAYISQKNKNNDDDDHEVISGTSMATPHAVSAIAVLKGYNKNLTFENVVDILKENAQDLGEEGWDQYYGHGLISFKDIEFCDGTYCDELGIYKDLNKNITSIETTNLSLTKYNYYSITNLMGSKIIVNYSDNTSEEIAIGDLPNVEISNYDPTATGIQTVTIKIGSSSNDIQITNPDDYESGWEYNTLANGTIEITGYKNHNLELEKLYIPETIDSKQVVAFADDFKFAESGNDIEFYTSLYLPSTFTRIGNYSLSETNIKYVYGSNDLEVGNHAFENSAIESINIPMTKIGDYAFKDCFELLSVDIPGTYSYESASNKQIANAYIGEYAFYNCKKLAKITKSKYDVVYVREIGNYAFYNCVSLSYFDLKPGSDIGEYAFYNTFLLSDIDLYNSDSIGQYAFYGSGISEASFSVSFDVISKSAFENCKNLKELSFNGKRIESRAFWDSGVEQIFLSGVEYIAEDAFAYAPIKSNNGTSSSESIYQVVSDLGIIENENKLLVGFTDAYGASNANITENITEIGNYAFTGNNTLKKIVIPENVTKIGTHAFEDCYNLANVYMLGNTISFENNTFKRNHEGEIQGEELKIYVYKDSETKQFVKNKNLNYRHIDPDDIIITNYEDTYKANSQLDFLNLGVKFVYYEEEEREEVIPTWTTSATPLSNNIGYSVIYQSENAHSFQYGDTYFTVEAINAVGYLVSQKIEVTVEKATPTYTIPTGLTANFGQKLSEITLPEHFEWMDGNQIITGSGEVIYKAKYVPTDTKNYETIENIDITITVSNNKTIINPEIVIENKTYDGTTNIETSSISVLNLESSEYSIVSATSSSANAGEQTATIVLRLSNEKFEDYIFNDGQQEKEFTVDFEILKANIILTDNSENVTVKYDGNPHSIEIDINCDLDTSIKYMDSNDEYTLDEIPTYTDVGTYTIKYKVYVNDNYNDYFGQKTLTIEDETTYIINKYDVDETNKYISKIIVNTDVTSFTSNIILGHGYGIEVDAKILNDKQLLYTGGKTRITKGLSPYREYTNIVIGDINGDAAINSADLLKVRQHLLGTNVLTGPYFLSSDINYDNTINSADLLRIRQHLLNTKTIE